MDIARIEDRIDKTAAGAVAISDEIGGIRFQSMLEVMEFSKLMAVAGAAVPKHLRANPGACLAVCIQALEWRMSPFAVASQSYVVGDNIGWQAQLVHAVIEQRAPIEGRLQHEFTGEGNDRRCRVWAKLKGSDKELSLNSPPIGQITPKNSPLWKTKPDIQLYYNTSRDFCRVYFPDVLLGVYAEDELRDAGPVIDAEPEKPTIGTRLAGSKTKQAAGFSAEHVERETKPKSEAQRGAVAETNAAPVRGDEPGASAMPASPDVGGAAPSAMTDKPPQPHSAAVRETTAAEAPAEPSGESGESAAASLARHAAADSTNSDAAESSPAAGDAAPPSAASPGPAGRPSAPAGLSSSEESVVRVLHKALAGMDDVSSIRAAADATIKQHGATSISPLFKAIDFVMARHVKRADGEKKWTVEAVEDAVEGMLMKATEKMGDLLGGGG